MPEMPHHHPKCMVCGPENAHEYGLRFSLEGDRVVGVVEVSEIQHGPPGFVHGGAIAAMIDDVASMIPITKRIPAVTASLSVDYRAPARLRGRLRVEAWEDRADGRSHFVRAEVRDDDGKLVAEGSVHFMEVDREWFAAADPADAKAGWLHAREQGF